MNQNAKSVSWSGGSIYSSTSDFIFLMTPIVSSSLKFSLVAATYLRGWKN